MQVQNYYMKILSILTNVCRVLGYNPVVSAEPIDNADSRIYCIGDIHGSITELVQLHSSIVSDGLNYDGHKSIIYLGDYVDRGNNTREVIECLSTTPLQGFESIFLKGNHEVFLLRFLEDASVGDAWFRFGGLKTLESYGIDITHSPKSASDYRDIQAQFIAEFPMLHKMFLLNGKLSYSSGNYFFCHAGINPRYSLAKQTEEDLLWIRDEFINCQSKFEKVIIHGHTISENVEIHHNRIAIDTGAYRTGILSCLVLEGDTRRVIQTSPDESSTK